MAQSFAELIAGHTGQLPAFAAGPAHPPLARAQRDLYAALPALALGGAERIVLDWAARNADRHRIHLLVTGTAAAEWSAPDRVEVVRADAADHVALEAFGRAAAQAGTNVLAHLLRAPERAAIAAGGAQVVPVIHNDREGWLEPAAALADAPFVVAVSSSVAKALREGGVRQRIMVIRHVPSVPRRSRALGELLRREWRLPANALVIGMVGGVKPQKGYPRALRVLAALLDQQEAFLVIVGGPTGREGQLALDAVRAQVDRLRLHPFVRLAGFLPDASRFLSAFDVVLNTSLYEGLSIATLEALGSGLPVVAASVGGQREIRSSALTLVPPDAPVETWVKALLDARGGGGRVPTWSRAPTHRLWTLAATVPPRASSPNVLFVTANLDVGGAQRSLANVARELAGRVPCEVAVVGASRWSAFTDQLLRAGVPIVGPGLSTDVFDLAESLAAHAAKVRASIVCFWNIDAKLKLAAAKAFAATGIKIVDVSPGPAAFEEMRAVREFGEQLAYSARRYWRTIDALVHKHATHFEGADPRRERVIPNGVRAPKRVKNDYALGPRPRVVVAARIVPNKYLHETVAAMQAVWETRAGCELHIYGAFDPQHLDYGERLRVAIADEIGTRVFLHGADAEVPERLAEYDVAIVLGHDQGCPNALLEALAAGLPAIANDSGGTREQVRHRRTGWLLGEVAPASIAAGIHALLEDRELAAHLGTSGRAHVLEKFSMDAMAKGYAQLFLQELAG